MHRLMEVKREFAGYEILTRSGSDAKENKWHSAVVLEDTGREYAIEDLKPSVSDVLTVRGCVLPDKASAIADPLKFTELLSGLPLLILLSCS